MSMTCRERILACCNGRKPDHVPLTTWCFGFKPKKELTWEKSGKPVKHWYSLRMEHIHTLPESWDLQDDFRRVLAWQSLGVDDILDVSYQSQVRNHFLIVQQADNIFSHQERLSNTDWIGNFDSFRGIREVLCFFI